MDGNYFFVIKVVMDGPHEGGATAMVDGPTLMAALQILRQGMWDVNTGKTAHWHTDRTHVHCQNNRWGRRGQRQCDDRTEQQDDKIAR